ncbi:HTH domain protein [compost metagenome]
MSKTKRLLDILTFVSSKKKFTAQQVADEFNISIRTVHRYILDLSEMGLPIYAEQGRHGGYTVITSTLLAPILFTEDEAVAIFFAFQSLQHYYNLPFTAEVGSVSQKLYRSLHNGAKNKVDQLRHHLTFWNPARTIDAPLLKDILEICMTGKNLRMRYESKSGIRDKYIHPIGVYAHDGLWYLPSHDLDKDKLLLYRVDRIISIEATEETQDHFITLEEWFNTYEIKKPIRLHLVLTTEGVRQCKSVPYFERFIVTHEDGTGYIDTTIDEAELSFIAPVLYRLGVDARVVEPKQLIDLMVVKAQEIMQMYSN